MVLIIPGSGPTDRDCNSTVNMKSDAFKLLAEALSENGISSLRIDKRVSGKSLNTFIASLNALRFSDFIQDAERWIEYLKVAGHSQGSLVGMIASKNRKIDKFISISGPARPIDDIMVEQFTVIEPEVGQRYRSFFDSIKAGSYDETSPLSMSMPKNMVPFLYEWFMFDPSIVIATLNADVLIINGEHDIQVPVSDAELLHKANPDSKLSIIPEMNHVLKNAPKDREANIATYNLPELPLNEMLIEEITQFVQKK